VGVRLLSGDEDGEQRAEIERRVAGAYASLWRLSPEGAKRIQAFQSRA
jgi:hypothetical protein